MTDTGGFMHSNTTPEVLELSAELMRAGADKEQITEEIFGNKRVAATRLLGPDHRRDAVRARRPLLLLATSTTRCSRETGADGEDTEDMVNVLRGQEGVEVAALFKAYDGEIRVSLRSSGRVNVQAAAGAFGRRRPLPRFGLDVARCAATRHSPPSMRRSRPKALSDALRHAPTHASGFVNVFKPAGQTSAQVVARVRRIYGVYGARPADRRRPSRHARSASRRRVAGRDRQSDAADSAARRSTQGLRRDRSCSGARRRRKTRSARRLRTGDLPAHWERKLEDALPQFIGKIAQVPPMFSAVHHEGKRLYDLAREGKTVERKARNVTIYGLTLLGTEAPNKARIARRVQRRHVRAHALRRSRRGDRRARAHGRARARGVGSVRPLRIAHARGDRRRSARRGDRRPNTSFRFRRSCSICAGRRIFAPAASCRCPKARRPRTSSCATIRARSSASAKRMARCSRRARCSSKCLNGGCP